MKNIIKRFYFLTYILIVTIIMLGVTPNSAYSQERITITTYYPAPYGVYKEMRVTEKMIFDDLAEVVILDGGGVEQPAMAFGQENFPAPLGANQWAVRFDVPIAVDNVLVGDEIYMRDGSHQLGVRLDEAEAYDLILAQAIESISAQIIAIVGVIVAVAAFLGIIAGIFSLGLIAIGVIALWGAPNVGIPQWWPDF